MPVAGIEPTSRPLHTNRGIARRGSSAWPEGITRPTLKISPGKAATGIRTLDMQITDLLLFHLSYSGKDRVATLPRGALLLRKEQIPRSDT